jgi:hypothetical protein
MKGLILEGELPKCKEFGNQNSNSNENLITYLHLSPNFYLWGSHKVWVQTGIQTNNTAP